jgi:ribosome maturation factor RimP
VGASSQADGVRALAGPVVAGAGLVLEGLQITPAGKRRVLRVTVDLPERATGGVPLEAVAQASRALSEALDASDVMGGTPYVLEVSSPGADRPLTERRHWSRSRGRLVRARLAGGGEHEGRLVEVDDDGIALADGARLGWAELAGGRVVLEFNRADGSAEPDDPADGDEDEPDQDEDEDESDEDQDDGLDEQEEG